MKQKGFGLLEILVYMAIFSAMILIIVASIFWVLGANSKLKAERELMDSASRALKAISSEILAAEGVYTPTTSASQLSLETERYALSGEQSSYIDFFLCGTDICFKRESQDPLAINSDNIEITNLEFADVFGNIKVTLAGRYKAPAGRPEYEAQISLTTTICLRK